MVAGTHDIQHKLVRYQKIQNKERERKCRTSVLHVKLGTLSKDDDHGYEKTTK